MIDIKTIRTKAERQVAYENCLKEALEQGYQACETGFTGEYWFAILIKEELTEEELKERTKMHTKMMVMPAAGLGYVQQMNEPVQEEVFKPVTEQNCCEMSTCPMVIKFGDETRCVRCERYVGETDGI